MLNDMFTGIIKKVSEVEKVSQRKGSFFVAIKKPAGWKIEKGESISINGVCSTVRSAGKKNFEVEYMPETLKKTTAGNFKAGTKVNLEKSLRVGDLLGGHFVQGHVDGAGKVDEVRKVKKSKVLKVNVPKKLMKFIVEKGSIAVDGISLTVVKTGKNWFSVSLVSYTLKNTILGGLKAGDKVNIETDMLARYLAKLLT
jgi:riboflavin synthase